MRDTIGQPGDVTFMPAPPKMITEKEAVLRERNAFLRGAEWRLRVWQQALRVNHTQGEDEIAQSRLAYPLPKVTRPRRATIHLANGGRILVSAVNGLLYDGGDISNRPLHSINVQEFGVQGLRDLADLLANPTEEVEAE